MLNQAKIEQMKFYIPFAQKKNATFLIRCIKLRAMLFL